MYNEKDANKYKKEWKEKIHKLKSEEMAYLGGLVLQELCVRGFLTQTVVDIVANDVDTNMESKEEL